MGKFAGQAALYQVNTSYSVSILDARTPYETKPKNIAVLYVIRAKAPNLSISAEKLKNIFDQISAEVD